MAAKVKHLDLLIEGTNFTSGLLVFGALKAGLKVGIVKPLMVEKAYAPEISNFYPSAISESSKALKDVQFLMKCSSLFPHLYFPQRVLTLSKNNKTNPGFNMTIDKLLGRDRESASLPITIKKYPGFQTLSESYSKGTLVYEYCFDRNRAVIELLKLNLQNGAELLDSEEDVSSRFRFSCKTQKKLNVELSAEDIGIAFSNTLKIKTACCDLILLKAFHHFSIQLQEIHTSNFDEFKQEVKACLKTLNLDPDLVNENKLKEKFETSALNNSQWTIEDPALSEQRSYFLALQKNISSQLNVKMNAELLFDSWKEKSMSGENFRSIQNECDEKFDLAKQTGIEYQRFFHLFYRYRFHIDKLIDEAYMQMNVVRNPQLIWDNVISSFLRSEESSF